MQSFNIMVFLILFPLMLAVARHLSVRRIAAAPANALIAGGSIPGISKTLLNSLVGKATPNYPQQKRMYTPATPGKVENEIVRCIFCRLCEKNCPTRALSVSKEKNEWGSTA